jgi:hypothetical protein
MPTWATLAGIAIGILLIGIAGGLYFGAGEDKSSFVTDKIATSVTVRFDGDSPLNLSAMNIKRWYFLKNGVVIASLDPETKLPKQETIAIWNMFLVFEFLVFEKPTAIHQLRVTGGPALPPFEIKVADPVHAVAVFSGDLSGKTVTAEAVLN